MEKMYNIVNKEYSYYLINECVLVNSSNNWKTEWNKLQAIKMIFFSLFFSAQASSSNSG